MFGSGASGDEDENVLCYEVFPSGVETGTDDLEGLRIRLLETVLPFLSGYIWQRQGFNLQVSSADGPQAPAWQQHRDCASAGSSVRRLWGQVAFGDNVEDEWFVVSLLMRATAVMPGIVARAWDNDGEFLLIEAAYQLPRWLRPESSLNRVFIYHGQLHVIPPPSMKWPTLPENPTLPEALRILHDGSVPTEASQGVRTAIDARIRDMPEGAVRKLMHTARVRVPATCAAVLSACPAAVGPAVEVFYSRDMQDMKAALRQQYFPAEEIISVLCRFNRCQYAQLQSQTWEPPKNYPLPKIDSPAYKESMLGAKLCAGLEMFVSRETAWLAKSQPTGACAAAEVDSTAPPKAAGPESWLKFLNRLKSLHYFKGEMEGSREHRRLMGEAWRCYCGQTGSSAIEWERRETLQSVLNALKEPINPDELARDGSGAEDADSWLTSASEELDRQLRRREEELDQYKASKKQSHQAEDDLGALDELASRMKDFVKHVSGLEGAEVPKGIGGDSAEAVLDPSQFMATLAEVLGVAPRSRSLASRDHESSSEGSSFFSDDDVGSEGSDGDELGARVVGKFSRATDWDARTATDSDDESSSTGTDGDDANFMDAYDQELEAQLRNTTLIESFDRTEQPIRAHPKDFQADKNSQEADEDNDLPPVDLDMNLVGSLLESLASQDGLAGPASNLAGMLGLRLP